MKFKRILALLVALLMLAASTALAEAPQMDVDISLYSQYPLVTDGSVTLTVAIPRDDTYGIDAEEMWWWKWWEQETGINFEVEQISKAALSERKNIMLASGDLPDIIWSFGFNTTDLLRYGDSEGLFLDLKEYITPEIMPFLSKFVEAYPETMSTISTPSGAVYSLPYYRAVFAGYSSDMYIDTNLLAKYNLEVPATLDDFTAMLRTFKSGDETLVPLSGGSKAFNPFYYILNAYGFLGQSSTNGEKITMREGKPVIPANDPVFKEALATMKTYYEEGLISQDYFTLDSVSVNGMLAEGKLGTYGQKVGYTMANYDDFSHWIAVKPLTSEYNPAQQWLAADAITIGGWVVSADTEHAELICRLADFFYSNIGTMYSKYGPPANSTDTLGMTAGIDFDPDDPISTTYRRLDALNGTYANSNEYEVKVPSGTLCVGNDAYDLESGMYLANWLRTELFGCEIDQTADLTSKIFNPTHLDNFHRISCNTNLFPFEVAGYPNICFFSEEQNERIVELRSVIDPYIEAEVAKFITGARSLDEFDAFQSELDGLGIDELEGIYADYYASLAK